MLAAYYTLAQPGSVPTDVLPPDVVVPLHVAMDRVRLVVRHAERTRLWLARSRTRTMCDDAYGDLLLATLEYGMGRRLLPLVPHLGERERLVDVYDELMTTLLEWSHELRIRCRTPLKNG